MMEQEFKIFIIIKQQVFKWGLCRQYNVRSVPPTGHKLLFNTIIRLHRSMSTLVQYTNKMKSSLKGAN